MQIPCFSLLQYPTGRTDHEQEVANNARKVVNDIKKGRNKLIERAITNTQSQKFINSNINTDTILIPIPKHSPIPNEGIWPAFIIAKTMHEKNYGSDVFDILERTQSVPKASRGGIRLKPLEHYNTIDFINQANHLFEIDNILLVDDVITQGSTCMGCYYRLLERFPNANIAAFSIFRTVNYKGVSQLLHPETGTIEWNNRIRTIWNDR